MEINLKIEDFIKDQYKEKIDLYVKFLLEENQKYNLTNITDIEDIYYKHILDSLSGLILLKNILKEEIYEKNICDLGPGAGFPSIPILIYDKKLNIILIESNKKKAQFLNEVKNLLDLSFEVINQNYREIINKKFDIVFFRALDTILSVIKNGKKLFKNKTYIYAYKGKLETIENEIFKLKATNFYNFIKKIEIHKIYGIKNEERNIVELIWER